MKNRHLFEKAEAIIDGAPSWDEVQRALTRLKQNDVIMEQHPEHIEADSARLDDPHAYALFYYAVTQAGEKCHRRVEGKGSYTWLIKNRPKIIKSELDAIRTELHDGWNMVGDVAVKQLPKEWSNHQVEGMALVTTAIATSADSIAEIKESLATPIACNFDRHQIATSKSFLNRIKLQTEVRTGELGA